MSIDLLNAAKDIQDQLTTAVGDLQQQLVQQAAAQQVAAGAYIERVAAKQSASVKMETWLRWRTAVLESRVSTWVTNVCAVLLDSQLHGQTLLVWPFLHQLLLPVVPTYMAEPGALLSKQGSWTLVCPVLAVAAELTNSCTTHTCRRFNYVQSLKKHKLLLPLLLQRSSTALLHWLRFSSDRQRQQHSISKRLLL